MIKHSLTEKFQSPPSPSIHPFLYPVFALLLVLNIAMPKGGVSWGDTPLTFGYMALALVTPFALLLVAKRTGLSLVPAMNFLLGYVPIGAMALLKVAYEGSTYGMVLYMTLLVVFPAIMLLVFAPVVEHLSEREIGTPLVWCIRFVTIWGLMNFVLYAATKSIIEIPYITTTLADMGTTVQKNNARGELVKLFSTYNNGNLFGVCAVMLFPVYAYFEKSRTFIGAASLAIAFSLSRTVWFGFAIMIVMMTVCGLIRGNRPWLWVTGGGLVAVLAMIMPMMGWTVDKVFEANIGGRMMYWNDLVLTAFGTGDARIREVLYAGLLQSFGIVGTLLALIALLFPVFYGVARFDQLSALRRSALVGICAYLFMAFSDAAFHYPPTIAILLFVVILLYRRGEAVDAAPAMAVAAPAVGAPPAVLSLAQAANRVR